MATIQNNMRPNVLYLNNFESSVIVKDPRLKKPVNTRTVLKVQGKLKIQTDTYWRESVYFTDRRRLVFKKQKTETSAEPPPAPITSLMDIIKSGVLHRLLMQDSKKTAQEHCESIKNIYN